MMVATRKNLFDIGSVHVSVWEDNATNPSDLHTDVECNIVSEDDTWACVGGGGKGSEDPGHMLTASYPMNNFKGWQISTKSHIKPDPTTPVVWAIGLKIDGLNREQLISNLKIASIVSAPGQQNNIGVVFPLDPNGEQEFAPLGGGFKVGTGPQLPGSGNFGVGSFLDGSFVWRARSKDMEIPTPLPLTVFAIGIRRTIKKPTNPQADFGFVDTAFQSSETLGNTNHPESIAKVPPNYALCGGGAVTHFSYWNGGSYLWDLEPVTEDTKDPAKQTFTGKAKDHFTVDPATITTYAMGVRLFPA